MSSGTDAVIRALSDPTRRETIKIHRKGPLKLGRDRPTLLQHLRDHFPTARRGQIPAGIEGGEMVCHHNRWVSVQY